MTDHSNKRVSLPTSGLILGALVKHLRLNLVKVVGKAAKALRQKPVLRFFGGECIVHARKAEICTHIAQAAIEMGWFPAFEAESNSSPTAAELWGKVLASLASQWDELVTKLPVRDLPVDFQDVGLQPFLRLFVIDLSLRYAAAVHLAGLAPPRDELPCWATKNGRCAHLRKLIDRCKPRPTREELANELEVQDTVLDRWLDNDIAPRDENITRLAQVLAPRLDVSVESLAFEIRQHQALSDLSSALANVIGRKSVQDLVHTLQKYTVWALLLQIESKLSPEVFMMFQEQSLFQGTAAEPNHFVIHHLARNETNPIWRADLEAIMHGRVIERLAHCLGLCRDAPNVLKKTGVGESTEDQTELVKSVMSMAQANLTQLPPQFAAGIPKDYKVLRISGDNASKASNRRIQAEQAMRLRDFERAIAHLNRALALEPDSAKSRCLLGAALWQSGKPQRAINELWIACKLDPKWDIPFVEIAIVHINAGEPAKARDHLIEAPPELSRTAHYWFYVGVAHHRLEEWSHARDALKESTQLDARNGRTWDLMADCCFRLGNSQEGLRYAKEAAHRGVPAALHEWEGRRKKA